MVGRGEVGGGEVGGGEMGNGEWGIEEIDKIDCCDWLGWLRSDLERREKRARFRRVAGPCQYIETLDQ